MRVSWGFLILMLAGIVLPACAPAPDPAPLRTLEARNAELAATLTAIAVPRQPAPTATTMPAPTATVVPLPSPTTIVPPTVSPTSSAVPSPTLTSTALPGPTLTPSTAPTPTRSATSIPSRSPTLTAGPTTPSRSAGAAPAPAAGDCRYVGNKNSKKLHLATCHSVADMKPENRVCFATREEAIAQGYEPCKVCKP